MQRSSWSPKQGHTTEASSSKEGVSSQSKSKHSPQKDLRHSNNLPKMADKAKKDAADESISSRTRSKRNGPGKNITNMRDPQNLAQVGGFKTFTLPLRPAALSRPILYLLQRPVPTDDYIKQASLVPQRLDNPRPLLIILDLNGCVLDRGKSKSGSGHPRPFLRQFINYCLSNHTVMVWSSASPMNVQSMSSMVFNSQKQRPIAVWDRTTLRLTPAEAAQRVQVYKQLQWVWEDGGIAKSHPDAESGGLWDQSNTILIDDSVEKAAAQPHNQLLIPEYKKENSMRDRELKVLLKVREYLEEAAHYDVSSFIRTYPFTVTASGAK